VQQEAQLMLMLTHTRDAFRGRQGHRTWYHSIYHVWIPISVL